MSVTPEEREAQLNALAPRPANCEVDDWYSPPPKGKGRLIGRFYVRGRGKPKPYPVENEELR